MDGIIYLHNLLGVALSQANKEIASLKIELERVTNALAETNHTPH